MSFWQHERNNLEIDNYTKVSYVMSVAPFVFAEFGQELLDAENHCNQLKAELQQFRKDLPQFCKDVGDASPSDNVGSPVRDEFMLKEQIPVKGHLSELFFDIAPLYNKTFV